MGLRLDELETTDADLASKALTRYTTATPSQPTAGTIITEAHGLGAIPRIFFGQLICQTAELGYSVGERARLDSYYATTGGTLNIAGLVLVPTFKYYGGSVSADATNVKLTVAKDGIMVMSQSAGQIGVPTAITPANWRVMLYAYL